MDMGSFDDPVVVPVVTPGKSTAPGRPIEADPADFPDIKISDLPPGMCVAGFDGTREYVVTTKTDEDGFQILCCMNDGVLESFDPDIRVGRQKNFRLRMIRA